MLPIIVLMKTHLIQVVVGLAVITVELANWTASGQGRTPPTTKAGQTLGKERHIIIALDRCGKGKLDQGRNGGENAK